MDKLLAFTIKQDCQGKEEMCGSQISSSYCMAEAANACGSVQFEGGTGVLFVWRPHLEKHRQLSPFCTL
jgi:hypothetical protein